MNYTKAFFKEYYCNNVGHIVFCVYNQGNRKIMLRKIKDKFYYLVVVKNDSVAYEYHTFVKNDVRLHKLFRVRSWFYLMRLIVHYRILRRKTLCLRVAKRHALEQKNKATLNNPVSASKPAPAKPAPAKPAPAKPAAHAPYPLGSESVGLKRQEEIFFVKQFYNYDIISFDVFDTLVLRPFAKPDDLFIIVGSELGMMNFHRIRTDAEKQARDNQFVKYGNREVTIYDIYSIINRRTGLDIEKGVQTEIKVELDYCFANPYMKKVFKILKGLGKKIIATSDMYLPSSVIEKILTNCGYSGFDKIYVSCEYYGSKRTGTLYKNILFDYKDYSIVHIGDNYTTDFEEPKKYGIDSVYYKNSHEIGQQYRPLGMTDLVGSYYSGLVNTKLHNGAYTYNKYFEYGYIFGGLYIYGYCNWIHRKVKAEHIDKVLFLARDGDIYKKVFDYLFDDVPNHYVFWSRIANTKYTIDINRDDFLTRMVHHKAIGVIPATFKEVLDSISLGKLAPLLKKSDLDEDMILSVDNEKYFESFFINNWDKVLSVYAKEEEFVKKELLDYIGDAKKIAIVDVGWLGTGPLGIKYLLEKKWNTGVEVKCYVAGSNHYIPDYNINELMTGTTETYIFSRQYNRELYDTHRLTNKGTNNIYFELFTQATHPSFSGYDKKGNYIFDIPEVEDYEIVENIQSGIMEFCKDYHKNAANYPILSNISGYDAYIPYRHLIRDLTLIRNLFSDLKYSRGVGTGKANKQERLSDIWKGANLK